jgi:hypothetical protein
MGVRMISTPTSDATHHICMNVRQHTGMYLSFACIDYSLLSISLNLLNT